jgi:glutathione S-transferase
MKNRFSMALLYHSTLDTASRFVRMVLHEYQRPFELEPINVWERRQAFLQLNPAGEVPVLKDDDGAVIVGGAVIADYCDEMYGAVRKDLRLLPAQSVYRAEVRRLITWALVKMEQETTHHLIREKALKRLMPPRFGGGSPDTGVLRAARQNLNGHLKYMGSLIRTRNWLAGEKISLADFAFASALSSIDYIGEMHWDEDKDVREWYARMKSRPSMRPVLSDVVRGIGPPSHYADPDF